METYNEEVNKRQAAEAKTADCDVCGGDMIYVPEKKALVCQFCQASKEVDFTNDEVNEMDILAIHEQDFSWDMDTKVVVCENCGGETVVEATEETAYCIYCGSQHMVERADESAGMKPQGVIPFQVGRNNARELMHTWVKHRWLAPKDLIQRFRGQDIKGVYMPYWTFDAQVHSEYQVRIGEYYYVGTGDKRQRKTRWHHHSGSQEAFYDDILVPGIDVQEQRILKKIEPFNTSRDQVMDFKVDFMAGYGAKKYTVMPDMARKVAREDMARNIENQIKRSLPGDTYEQFRQNLFYSRETFKHILLPVYRTAYTYNNKVYQVMINGQTGEVQGSAPVSPLKVAGLVALGVVIMGVVWYFSNH